MCRLGRSRTWPVPEQVFPGVCGHCGAAWDDAHEQGRCGVMEATERILRDYRPRPLSREQAQELLERIDPPVPTLDPVDPRPPLHASGHKFVLLGGAGGWEVWGCEYCGRECYPALLGFLWPEVLGRLFKRWRCPGAPAQRSDQ